VIRSFAIVAAVAALTTLAGCAEREQNSSGVKSDSPSYRGTGMPYALPDWKQGDRASWEQTLKTRVQGQDDYARIN
jgi:hypothetical protein